VFLQEEDSLFFFCFVSEVPVLFHDSEELNSFNCSRVFIRLEAQNSSNCIEFSMVTSLVLMEARKHRRMDMCWLKRLHSFVLDFLSDKGSFDAQSSNKARIFVASNGPVREPGIGKLSVMEKYKSAALAMRQT